MYQYLVYRMKANGISNEAICSLLGISDKTFRNKLKGITAFTWNEAKKIKQAYFPDEDIEELFKVEVA